MVKVFTKNLPQAILLTCLLLNPFIMPLVVRLEPLEVLDHLALITMTLLFEATDLQAIKMDPVDLLGDLLTGRPL
jgi:hypothetical protein